MFKIKIIAILLFLCTTTSFAQSKNEQAVRQTLSDQSAAWNRGNIDSFMIGYWQNDSLVFIGKKGLTFGWKNTLDNYKKSYPNIKAMGQLKFTILIVKQLSKQYQEVVGKWHLNREEGDLEGHFTLLFKKIKGNWVIIMDHSS